MFDTDTIAHEVFSRVYAHYHQLGRVLYPTGMREQPKPLLHDSPLYADVSLLVQVANGAYARATVDKDLLDNVFDAVQRLTDLLTIPAGGTMLAIPASTFWAQPGIGQVLTHVHAWLRSDDLIGYSEAAHVLVPDLAETNIQAARMRIKRLVERGTLLSYINPDEANPTRQMRVSRQAVEALRAAKDQAADEPSANKRKDLPHES